MMDMKAKPWDKVKLPTNIVAGIYTDWGLHYKKKNLFSRSEKAFSDSLHLRPDDLHTLLGRSRTHRDMAKIEAAYEDLITCQGINNHSVTVDKGFCELLYDLNRLEDAAVENHRNIQKYRGNQIGQFRSNLHVLQENFNDSLGDSLGPFIMKNEKIFKIVADLLEQERQIDERPLWKKLRDEGKCDIQSIPDIEPIELHPRERARRELAFRIYLQTYFNKSWEEVIFLKKLHKNPNFLLNISKSTYNELSELACNANQSTMKFLKMLQVRSPLYNEKRRICPKLANCEKTKEKRLNFIQYKTKRFMHQTLKSAHQLRADGKLKALAELVEYAMGDFTILKTFRVMPWKIEFINEVYNILGLTYADKLKIPEILPELDASLRLKKLLRLSLLKFAPPPSFVFGDKSTFSEPDAHDPKYEAYKVYLERMKKRLLFAKYPIEQAYIYHEISRNHITQNNFDESVPMARKGLDAAKQCNNYLWQFLNIIQIIKSRAALNKLEYLKDSLREAENIAQKLANENLVEYIRTGHDICEEVHQARVREHKSLSLKARKSNMSMKSFMSYKSNESLTDPMP